MLARSKTHNYPLSGVISYDDNVKDTLCIDDVSLGTPQLRRTAAACGLFCRPISFHTRTANAKKVGVTMFNET